MCNNICEPEKKLLTASSGWVIKNYSLVLPYTFRYDTTKNPYILALKIWNFLDIFAQSEYDKDHPTLIIIEEINKKNGINPLKAWWGIDVSIDLWNKATYYLFIV